MRQLRLSLLGVPAVHLDGQPVHMRTHKALALLVYLAVQPGPHSRDLLAELLWTGQPSALRAALRVTLHQLQTALGRFSGLCVTHRSVDLRRDETLWVDALELERLASDQFSLHQPAITALWRGEFLQGLSVQSAPAWDDWVCAQTVLQEERFDALLARLMGTHLAAGRVWDAIATARRRVIHSPLSEDAYLQLSRAQRAAGLHAEAHRSERQGREVLLQELGMEPEWIGPLFSSSAPQNSIAPPQLTPAQVSTQTAFREMPLIGREALLQQMDEAWEQGQMVFLAGEGGLGKTRLAQAFFARQGREPVKVEAQPADSTVPFALVAQMVRAVLPFLTRPELSDALRYELSRLVPELWPEVASTLETPTAKLRLYDAYIEVISQSYRANVALLIENVQLWDEESHILGGYASVHGPERGGHIRCVITYRPSTLSPARLVSVLSPVEHKGAVLLNVPSMSIEEVHEVLAYLEPRATSALAERLTHFTGGNALFVVETARLLQARGGLLHPDYRELPKSPRISEVIGQRLARLSQGALDVARVAALAGPIFSFKVATQVLARDEIEIASAFEELDLAGLFKGERFTHDLLETTAHDLTPELLRMALHRRLLNTLDGTHPAALRAGHALGGQRWTEAHQLLTRASQDAHGLLALEDAERFAGQARALLTEHGGPLVAAPPDE